MWQTLVVWSSASRVVQTIAAVVAWLVGIVRGTWLATIVSREWSEHPASYQTSRFRVSLGAMVSRLLSWHPTTTWWQGSWLLGSWPAWLAADLAWAWEHSLLSRAWSGYGRLIMADDWGPSDAAQTSAPPLWRVLLYVLLLGVTALAVWRLPFGLLPVKLLLAGVALLLLWARPNWAAYVVAVTLPVLPVLSTTYLIGWALLASWLQGQVKRRQS